MLKLNASYSKKVPADTEYSSQSYHASVEVELPDGLSHEELNARIRETFALVRDSVENELHGNSFQPSSLQAHPQNMPSHQNASKPSYAKKTSDAPASPKQLKYLVDLASQFGMTPEDLKEKYNVATLETLTKVQCSKAIDELRKAA